MPNTRTVCLYTGRSTGGLTSGISVVMMKVLRDLQDLPEKVVPHCIFRLVVL